MSISNRLTDNDERLIAKDIAIMLTQKGVSYAEANDILDYAHDVIRNIPLIELENQNEQLPDAIKKIGKNPFTL